MRTPYEYVDGTVTRIAVGPPDPLNPPQMPDDGYPAIIADARHAYGVETPDELVEFWAQAIERLYRRLPNIDLTQSAVPYINRARWLVDCPACNAGNYCWDRMPEACCLECALVFKVMWQLPMIRSAAIRLLAVREVVNCNWNAHKGERVEDLERENRWMLDKPSVVKSGLVVPRGLDVPDALAKYVDPKVV